MARGQNIETRTEESRDDWCTSEEGLAPVIAYGEIILDPCSGPHSIVPARRALYENSKPDGLTADWAAIVAAQKLERTPLIFINPPYKNTEQWVDKIRSYYLNDAHPFDTILLIPVRTDTALFHTIAAVSDVLCFRKGRLKFALDGVEKKGPRHANLYVGWVRDVVRFHECFDKVGTVRRASAPF